MIDQKYLRRFSVYSIIISLIFGLLSYFNIQYQIYLWEIFVNLKILLYVCLILFIYNRKQISFSSVQLSLLRFEWKRNTGIFFAPVLLYAISIGVGLLSNEISINKPDNAATLIIATLFDIPAIYVFSATSILIEEIIFRGAILPSFQQTHSKIQSAIISSTLWTAFMVSEILSNGELTAVNVAVLLLFFISLGLFSSALFFRYRSIWPGYSFRIGITTLTPITLTAQLVESDSFFKTNSSFFIAEGIVVSALMVGLSAFIVRKGNLEPGEMYY